MLRCPGQDQRFWRPDDIFEIKCPECGTVLEFWKDEPKQKCPGCKRLIANPRLDLGCAKWCQYARECLGAVASAENSDSSAGVDLCSRLIAEMRDVFAADKSRIDRALKTLMYAEHIQAAEGGEPLVVKAAAVLHDVPVSDGARILGKQGVNAQVIDKICAVIGPDAKGRGFLEFKILSDAHKLADFQATFAGLDKDAASARIESSFETAQGRKIANQLLADL